MIWTIKVTLVGGAYATSECVRVFQMDSATCLEDLHYLIQRFEVSRTRKAPFAAVPGIKYPVLIEKIGKNPKQYP